MQNDLISIIIPVYRVEKWLPRCVDSILRQSYTKLEIILVDDGSPDGCGGICDAYAAADPRIVVCHKENGGLSDARNAGVRLATGAYVTFIDSDDYVAPNYVEYLYRLLQTSGADISCCGYLETDTDDCPFLQSDEILRYTPAEACMQMIERQLALVVAVGKLLPIALVKRYPFPKGKLHEDEFISYRYYFDARLIVLGQARLYAYFHNSSGIMSSVKTIKDTDAYEAYRQRSAFFETRGERKLADASWRRYRRKLIYDNKMHHNWSLDEYKQLLKHHLFRSTFTLREKLYDICYIYLPWLRNIGKKCNACFHRS